MKRRWPTALLLAAILSTFGCGTGHNVNAVTQVSVLDALLAGDYGGKITCAQLLDYGDMGLGTLDHLDGEMIVADGVVYQARSDGTVVRPAPSVTVPFAAVCFFSPVSEISLPSGLDFAGFRKWLDEREPERNLPLAVTVSGRFESMKVRSVPRQDKPYPPLAEVTPHQSVFDHSDIPGRIVGFRLPGFLKGVNVSGYHLHFISSDGSVGGHILDFRSGKGTVSSAFCDSLCVLLPSDDPDYRNLDLSRSRAGDIAAVEK
ncbi:MAG TPA: acetolactate decarboxylase [bacterium]|nr:acetolactate decarboxylase [bacterium]HPJ72756.1 acetolactate decarboxylase [bacterium]HPQ65939.1 acetolactate decarboxylase [bacterium]